MATGTRASRLSARRADAAPSAARTDDPTALSPAAAALRNVADTRRTEGDSCCAGRRDRKSTRLNSSHGYISYAVFCLKKKKHAHHTINCVRQTPALHLQP